MDLLRGTTSLALNLKEIDLVLTYKFITANLGSEKPSIEWLPWHNWQSNIKKKKGAMKQ